MPYKISGKGDGLGCKGYAVQDDAGKVVGCHSTRMAAENQIKALYANVEDAKKDMSITVDPKYPGVGVKRPEQGRAGGKTGSFTKPKYGKDPRKKRWGRHSDAQDAAQGAISSGGGGGSIG
jgi:hypothetical protein